MTLRLLFAAGDVGGARALYPAIAEAVRSGHDVHMLQHGHLAAMPPIAGVHLHQPDAPVLSGDDAATLLRMVSPAVLAFASSVSDPSALRLASAARESGLPVAHLLDNWTSYRRRLELDGNLIVPDLYAVMDEVASRATLQEGFDPRTVKTTGTPALGDLAAWAPPEPPRQELRIVFVSEPVRQDQGEDPAALRFRGYVEDKCIALLAEAMRGRRQDIRIDLLPHPREDAASLDRTWQSCRGELAGGIVAAQDRDNALRQAHGVVGMASILLYEMWLRSWPVASVQPELRLPELRMLADKKGVEFIDSTDLAVARLRAWASGISSYRPPDETAKERLRHRNAAKSFLAALGDLAADHSSRRHP